MKKFFFLLLLIPINLVAQTDTTSKSNFSFSVVLKNHLPVGYFKRMYSYGIGGALNAELKISKSLSVVLNPGYLNYFYNQKVVGISGSTGYILLLGGAKFYPVKKFYVMGEAGVGIKTSKFGKESGLAYSGGAGFLVTKNIGIGLEYAKGSGSTFSAENIGVNAAYTFFRNRQSKR